MAALLLLLALLLPVVVGIDCPADLSREARSVVASALDGAELGALPAGCILRPDNDIQLRTDSLLAISRQLNEDNAARRSDVPQWLCPLCVAEQKQQHQQQQPFASTLGYWSEMLLERHLWQRHSAQVGRNSSTEVCLADFCDVLGCPSWLRSHAGHDCDLVATKTRLAKCKQVFAQCYPPEASPESLAAYRAVAARFCVARGCDTAPVADASPQSRPPGFLPGSRSLLYLLIAAVALFYFCYWRSSRRALRAADFASRTRRGAQSTWTGFASPKKNPI